MSSEPVKFYMLGFFTNKVHVRVHFQWSVHELVYCSLVFNPRDFQHGGFPFSENDTNILMYCVSGL